MKPAHLILLVVMNFFWAGSYSAFKALAPHLDPGGVATMRFGLSAILLLAAWPWLPGKTPRGRDLALTALMGVIVFVLAPRLQVAGVQLGQAGDAAVLMGLEPLIGSLMAAVFLHEHIGPRRWVGFILGLAGVVLMAEVWRPDFHLPGLAANVLIFASFFAESAYSVMGKPLIARAGLIKVLALALLAGTVVNAGVDGGHTFAAARVLPLGAWLLLLYLVLICTVAGCVLWFVVVREAEVNVVVLTVFLQPVVGVIIAVVMLGEKLHWGQLWGSTAILVGLVIALSRQVKRVDGT
ncbi:MAG: DMT family transporter [Pedosphaera sp.]|nr:DMT family transporter [Pedosphaera sp.]